MLVGLAIGGGAAVALGALVFGPRLWPAQPARSMVAPLPVPPGDQEIALINSGTSYSTWERVVIGLKRAAVADSTLEVDDSGAFRDQSTAVPEVMVGRKGVAGRLWFRWYKVASDAPAEKWVEALAARSPPPLAVLGGWSSDRAVELAVALKKQLDRGGWAGDPPLLLIAQATAETLAHEPADPNQFSPPDGRKLIDVYPERTFRFCFTNRQMAAAVTDFVFTDPTLRPGLVDWPGQRTAPGLHAAPAAAAGPWAALANLADVAVDDAPRAFLLAWEDDPYSLDLRQQFQAAIVRELRPHGPTDEEFARFCRNFPTRDIAFSTGPFARPNPPEIEAARSVLNALPPRGYRSLLVIPTVDAPARRVLRYLCEGVPVIGRRLVATTGDGVSVNTVYRDGEFAWPVRAIPVPLVLFTHQDPFRWDTSADPPMPEGCAYRRPNCTDEARHAALIGQMVIRGAFPSGTPGEAPQIVSSTNQLRDRFRVLPRPPEPGLPTATRPFFQADGNRRADTAPYIVLLRPKLPERQVSPTARADAVVQVYRGERRGAEWDWMKVHEEEIEQGRADWGTEE